MLNKKSGAATIGKALEGMRATRNRLHEGIVMCNREQAAIRVKQAALAQENQDNIAAIEDALEVIGNIEAILPKSGTK